MFLNKKGFIGCGCLLVLILLLIIFLIIILTIVQIGNVTNYRVIYNFGTRQYFANILHHESRRGYYKANSDHKVFDRILRIEDYEQTKEKLLLKKGQQFKREGARNVGYVYWVAIKVYKGQDPLYGYFMIPKDFFGNTEEEKKYMEECDQEYSKFKEKLHQTFYDDFRIEAFKNIKIMETSGALNLQKIKESNDLIVIDKSYFDAPKETAFYCSKNDYKYLRSLYRSLYNAYMENSERFYIQVDDQVTIKTGSFQKTFSGDFFKDSTKPLGLDNQTLKNVPRK